MAERELYGKIIQIRKLNGCDPYQKIYDSEMKKAVARGFFESAIPCQYTAPDWQPSLMVVHFRAGLQFYEPAWVDMPVFKDDKLVTGPNGVAALEFMIGGRIGINKSSCVIVANQRSVVDCATDLRRMVLRKGGMWAKAAKLKEPIEVQTNGGVMGVRG